MPVLLAWRLVRRETGVCYPGATRPLPQRGPRRPPRERPAAAGAAGSLWQPAPLPLAVAPGFALPGSPPALPVLSLRLPSEARPGTAGRRAAGRGCVLLPAWGTGSPLSAGSGSVARLARGGVSSQLGCPGAMARASLPLLLLLAALGSRGQPPPALQRGTGERGARASFAPAGAREDVEGKATLPAARESLR